MSGADGSGGHAPPAESNSDQMRLPEHYAAAVWSSAFSIFLATAVVMRECVCESVVERLLSSVRFSTMSLCALLSSHRMCTWVAALATPH